MRRRRGHNPCGVPSATRAAAVARGHPREGTPALGAARGAMPVVPPPLSLGGGRGATQNHSSASRASPGSFILGKIIKKGARGELEGSVGSWGCSEQPG